MSIVDAPCADPEGRIPRPIVLSNDHNRGDRIFRGGVKVAGGFSLLIPFFIGLFLFLQGLPAMPRVGFHFFNASGYVPNDGTNGATGFCLVRAELRLTVVTTEEGILCGCRRSGAWLSRAPLGARLTDHPLAHTPERENRLRTAERARRSPPEPQSTGNTR